MGAGHQGSHHVLEGIGIEVVTVSSSVGRQQACVPICILSGSLAVTRLIADLLLAVIPYGLLCMDSTTNDDTTPLCSLLRTQSVYLRNLLARAHNVALPLSHCQTGPGAKKKAARKSKHSDSKARALCNDVPPSVCLRPVMCSVLCPLCAVPQAMATEMQPRTPTKTTMQVRHRACQKVQCR